MKTIIQNGKIINQKFELEDGVVVVKDGKIEFVGKEYPGQADCVVDAKGMYVSPGFIDIHVHGGGGYDFMDADAKEYADIAKYHAQFGTTTLYPTTVASTFEETKTVLEAFRTAKTAKGGAKMRGIHLEGPYVSKNMSGALDPRYIRNPKPEEYNAFLEMAQGGIARWTIAPEHEGAMELGDRLVKEGVLPSIGHSEAEMSVVTEAMRHGYRLVTHLYSCTSTVVRKQGYRFAGIIEAAFYYDDLDVEIIADGRHLPADLLKLIYKIKGYEHVALITDAMRAAGGTQGEFLLGSRKGGTLAVVEDGVAKLPDRTAFAGSIATTDRLVRTMVNEAEVPLEKAVYMASYKPAQIMKIDSECGSLEAGKAADLLIFDSNINVKYTMVDGEVVYNAMNA